MLKFLLAASATSVMLGAGIASAQGLPPGTVPPVYGSVWSANQLNSHGFAKASEDTRQARSEPTPNPQLAKQNVNLSPVSQNGRPTGEHRAN